MDIGTFVTNICGRRGPKKMKVSNSWGVYDTYKYIRKNKWEGIGKPVSEHDYYAIIRGVNNLLAEKLKKGETVKFPCGMGKLELRKFACKAGVRDGKIKVNYPIDWKRTLELWYEDKEARESKVLVRREPKEVFYIKYNKFSATYNNQNYYDFDINRFVKIGLKDNIKNGVIDALW